MSNLNELITAAVKCEGIDLIGFAGADRFVDVPAQQNPFSIFPEGKTVIMLGKRVCRGALRGVEEGSNFGDYRLFGSRWLEDEFLSLACYNLVRVLEDEGFEAVPVFPNPSELAPMGVSVAEGRPAPNVCPDFDRAAVACGLGEIGLSGLFLSPEFGSRQRFHMIITDAELEATPLATRRVCDGCGKCAAVCPFGAIDTEHTTEVNICGKVMQVATVNYKICNTCKNGACPNRLAAVGKPDRVAALCNRTCLCHLEEQNVLDNKFETPFRKKAAWVIGENDAKGTITDDMVSGGEYQAKGGKN
ncbi:MAG: 4Fe-4S binding protein [Clostridia bacterium]|nr:4Fe-4S binding protein [Clostridia bacterium]